MNSETVFSGYEYFTTYSGGLPGSKELEGYLKEIIEIIIRTGRLGGSEEYQQITKFLCDKNTCLSFPKSDNKESGFRD